MLSQRMYKYIWGWYKSFPNPLWFCLQPAHASFTLWVSPVFLQLQKLLAKKSQTRIYGTGNNSVHKYIDLYPLRSGNQQNRNVPSPVSPARGIKAFQLILQPSLACHPVLEAFDSVLLAQMAWCVALHVLYNVLSWPRQMLWANGRIIETGDYHITSKDVVLHYHI